MYIQNAPKVFRIYKRKQENLLGIIQSVETCRIRHLSTKTMSNRVEGHLFRSDLSNAVESKSLESCIKVITNSKKSCKKLSCFLQLSFMSVVRFLMVIRTPFSLICAGNSKRKKRVRILSPKSSDFSHFSCCFGDNLVSLFCRDQVDECCRNGELMSNNKSKSKGCKANGLGSIRKQKRKRKTNY